MILYHGTTVDIAEKIRLEGLKPHRETAFKFQREDRFSRIDDHPMEHLPYVYVTPDRKLAEYFASFRARYERARYGEKIQWSTEVSMRKYDERRNALATPAIIRFILPDDWNEKLEPDPQGDSKGRIGGFVEDGREVSYTAQICGCSIPSNFVAEVLPLPGILNSVALA